MLTALHAKRNRPYLRTFVFVLLVSWISLTISATCTMAMPSVVTAMPEHMQGCLESDAPEHSHHQDHAPKMMQDCSFKPCLDSQNHSLPDLHRLVKPDLPVLILGLFWTFCYLFLSYPTTQVPRKKTDPPLGRRILLIYRFCTLLN